MSVPCYPVWMPALAVLSGAFFSLIGISYRIGQSRLVRPEPIAAFVGLAGVIVFALRTRGIDYGSVPAVVIALGAIVGAAQYILVKLVRVALARGPLSPLWCVLSLSSMPAVVAARFAFGEELAPLQMVGLALTVVCVAFGSRLQQQPAGGPQRAAAAGRRAFVYVIILFATLAINSTSAIALNYLGRTPGAGAASHMHRFGEPYLLTFYLALCVPLWLDVVLSRRGGVRWSWAAPLGMLAATGSIVGMSMWRVCAPMPAATLFTVANVVSILSASLVSVVFFAERRPAAWYAMIASGVTAVVLFNLDALLPAG